MFTTPTTNEQKAARAQALAVKAAKRRHPVQTNRVAGAFRRKGEGRRDWRQRLAAGVL